MVNTEIVASLSGSFGYNTDNVIKARLVSADQAEIQAFVDLHKDTLYIFKKDLTKSWGGYDFVSAPENHIFEALVFGTKIDRSDIDPSLTIELKGKVPNGRNEISYYRELAAGLDKTFRMWRVFCARPLYLERGIKGIPSTDFQYLTCPVWLDTTARADAHQDDEDAHQDAWRREIAMQAGMGMGIKAYNDYLES